MENKRTFRFTTRLRSVGSDGIMDVPHPVILRLHDMPTSMAMNVLNLSVTSATSWPTSDHGMTRWLPP